MITATARKHIVRALREALRIREGHAREILTTIRNAIALDLLGNTDMRTVKALVINCMETSPTIQLYVDAGQGYEFTGVSLHLVYEDLDRWNKLSLEEAYAIAADVHNNRGPEMTAADDLLAAEMTKEVMDALPEEEMDRLFGKAPEARDYKWVNGKVQSAELAPAGDHVVTQVALDDGTNTSMAMFALFGTPADLLAYASEQLDIPARLCVSNISVFDKDVPAGFDRSMPVLDMIVHTLDRSERAYLRMTNA